MPKRKHKKFSRPRKLFDINLIKEENNLIKKYGLKSRREVWRANYAIERLRNIAKKLITADEGLKNEFLERQIKKGFNVSTIADVLALSKEDYLKRRLQSVLVARGLAKTHKQARQVITHKHVSIDKRYIDSPSHLTTLEEENSISINLKIPNKETITEEEKRALRMMKKATEEEKDE